MENRIDNNIYKVLRNKLKEYNDIQNEILDIESDVFNCNTDINSGIKAKNKTNCSFENPAISLVQNEKYQELQAWKKCIDCLLTYYINSPQKLKFLKQRYIDCNLVHFNLKGKLKDIDVIRDLEIAGYLYTERTWIRWKNEILNKLYDLTQKDKILKNYKFF